MLVTEIVKILLIIYFLQNPKTSIPMMFKLAQKIYIFPKNTELLYILLCMYTHKNRYNHCTQL